MIKKNDITGFKCSLCGSTRLISESTWDSSHIKKLYKSQYNFNAENYFPEKHFSTYRCIDCDLRSHHPAKCGTGEFYDHMQQFEFYYETEKPEYSYAIDKLIETKGTKILDIGCGEGNYLKKIKDTFLVRAAEYSEKSKRKLADAGIVMDEENDKYDFIVSFQVLEHVENTHEFIEFAVNKLNLGGHLLITVPNFDSRYSKESFSLLDYPPHHMTQWSKASIYNIAELFNLKLVDYYTEPLRIEHYYGLIKGRRDRIANKGIKGKIQKFSTLLLDSFFAPYFFDQVNYPGLTHGALYKKDE